MVYCEHCGSANDLMNSHCHRCGQPLPQDEFATIPRQPVAARPAETATSTYAPTEMTGTPLGTALDLPDWLRAAAAATPETAPPPAPARPDDPPPGFVVAQAAPAPSVGTNELFSQRPASEPPMAPPPATPLPPVPTSGLAESLPEWLRASAGSNARTQSAASADQANPASFISESDLPEWIRQIAAADEAKRLEDERSAAETAAGDAAARRAAMPGESAAGAAANPWLTRRDQAASAAAWGGTPPPASPAAAVARPLTHADEEEAAPEVVRIEPETTPVAQAAESGKRVKLGKPRVGLPKVSVPKPTMPSTSGADAPAGREALIRYALIGAIALLVLIVLVAVVL